ncbi:MAG: SGNH/GDSL hydrolase family protein [Nitrosospira sp.]|nr:SGNH/GDSL hydrolase family protein [Nitrosospira sp.]
MRNIISVWLLLVAVFALPAASAVPTNYDAFYVFGDSLSDTGSDFILTTSLRMDPPIPPSESPHRTYYKGRFSNGPVAVEYLWRQLKNGATLTPFLSNIKLDSLGGISFAFGGSTSGYLNQVPGGFYVPGTLGQVELFRKALKRKKAPTALYAIWTGGNDYLLAGTNEPDAVVANIIKAIQTLYSLGARDFLIPNLPDLGLTPLIQVKGPEAQAQFLQLTRDHNALLGQALHRLAPRLPRIKIYVVDLFTLSQTLVNENTVITMPPALEYLAPGTGATDCFIRNPKSCPDVDLTAELPPFAFWDAMHPTTFVHELYGQAMFERLQTGDPELPQ